MSKPYMPTPEQIDEPALRRAWVGRSSEEETIQVAFEELRDLRGRIAALEQRTPCQD